MSNTLAIAWKETQVYFSTPAAYIVVAMFLVVSGIFFVSDVTTVFADASVRGFVNWIAFFTLFMSPILTMRLLSEEKKIGTLELLLTAPVRDWEVVAGKYIASILVFTLALALTLYYVLLLYWFGDPDTGPVLSAYLGLFLHGSATLAVGIMASSLSSNQIVAAAVGTVLLLSLFFLDRVATTFSGVVADVLHGLSLNTRFVDFTRGVVETGHIVFYVSVSTIFLFFAVKSLEMRRW